MELEDLIDKYKNSKPIIRLLLVASLAVLPSLYVWMEEGDRIAVDLEDASSQESTASSKLSQAKQKVAQLPGLLEKLNEIEVQLNRARDVLPDSLEIDKILAILGGLESQFGIKVMKFTPGNEVSPKNGLEYQELPIDLEVRGQFSQVMQFYDNLVHLGNLTHLRSVEIEKLVAENEGEQLIQSRSKLILFKGQ